MSTMASNAVECVGKKVKKWVGKKKREDEKRGKGKDKQGREEGLASQHAAISVFILAEQPDTRGRSPWHTASTKAVCFGLDENKRQVKDKGKKTEWLVWL